MSDTPAIYAAMAAVMESVQGVAKKDRNDHQKFMFRGIDAVVNAVGPALREHKVVVVPQVHDVTYDQVQTSTGKPATACRVQVNYVFCASDGSQLEASVAAEAWDSGDKAAPKAMSVAFRTALLQALSLPTDEPDPDSHTYERAEQTNGKPRPPDTSPKALVVQKLRDEHVEMQRFVDFLGSTYGVEKFDELAEEDRTKVVVGLTTGDLVEQLKADA